MKYLLSNMTILLILIFLRLTTQTITVLEEKISISNENNTNSLPKNLCQNMRGNLLIRIKSKLFPVFVKIDLQNFTLFLKNSPNKGKIIHLSEIAHWKRTGKNCFFLFINVLNKNKELHSSKIEFCGLNKQQYEVWINKINQMKNCRHGDNYKTKVLYDFDKLQGLSDKDRLNDLAKDPVKDHCCDKGKDLSNQSEEMINKSIKDIKKSIRLSHIAKRNVHRKYINKLKKYQKKTQKIQNKSDFIKNLLIRKNEIESAAHNKLVTFQQTHKEVSYLAKMKKKLLENQAKMIEKEKLQFKKLIEKEKTKAKSISSNLLTLIKKSSLIPQKINDSSLQCFGNDILSLGFNYHSKRICGKLKLSEKALKKCVKSKNFCQICCEKQEEFFDKRKDCISKCKKIMKKRAKIKDGIYKKMTFDKKIELIKKKVNEIRHFKKIIEFTPSKLNDRILYQKKKDLKKMVVKVFRLNKNKTVKKKDKNVLFNILHRYKKIKKNIAKRIKKNNIFQQIKKKTKRPHLPSNKTISGLEVEYNEISKIARERLEHIKNSLNKTKNYSSIKINNEIKNDIKIDEMIKKLSQNTKLMNFLKKASPEKATELLNKFYKKLVKEQISVNKNQKYQKRNSHRKEDDKYPHNHTSSINKESNIIK